MIDSAFNPYDRGYVSIKMNLNETSCFAKGFFQHKRKTFVVKLVVWMREWQNWGSQICQRCREIRKEGKDNEVVIICF